MWVGVAGWLGLSHGVSIAGLVVLCALAGWWLTGPSAAVLGGITFLVADGFVQDSAGQLGWIGAADAALLLALVLVPMLSSALATGARREQADLVGRLEHEGATLTIDDG
jgi:hypothetical protein